MILKRFFGILITVFFVYACAGPDSKKVDVSDVAVNRVDTLRIQIDQLSKSIRETPKDDTLFYQRSRAYAIYGDIKNAVNDLEIAMKLNPDDPIYYLELADLELARGESRIAKDVLSRANEKFPENVEVMIRLANIYMAIGQFSEARTKLIIASRIEPRNPNLYMLSSIIFTEIGDDDRAIEELQKAIMYDPEFYDGHVMLGVINARLGRTVARDHYENAMRLRPENPEPLYNLGMYFQENKMYDEALKTYKKGLDNIDSRMQHFLFNIGYVYENFKKEPDSAIDYFQKVIQYHPSDFRAYYHKGLCYEMKGEPEKAMAAYDMSLKVNPDFEEAFEALSILSDKRQKK